MSNLKKLIFIIETINSKVGDTTAWLVLLMTLTAFLVSVLRYFFNIGYVWMQESYVWMHGVIFLFGAGYTLLTDQHVRVDIFYRLTNERGRAIINLVFSIFLLLPFIFVITKYSIPYVLKSWYSFETSREAGGLSFLYLYKTTLILFCFFLLIQTISLILRCILVLLKKEKKIFFKFLNK